MPKMYKTGDRVQVLTWDRLLQFGGLDDRGRIILGHPQNLYFIPEMAHLCGKVIEVTEDYAKNAYDEQILHRLRIEGLMYKITNFMVQPFSSKYPTNVGTYAKATR